MVRPADRISGPNTAPVMASFTHTQPSRFSDGSFGVYYAANDEATAIAETVYHRARFLRDAGFANERLDMRVYTATIKGALDDLRAKTARSKLYDPKSYAFRAHTPRGCIGGTLSTASYTAAFGVARANASWSFGRRDCRYAAFRTTCNTALKTSV